MDVGRWKENIFSIFPNTRDSTFLFIFFYSLIFVARRCISVLHCVPLHFVFLYSKFLFTFPAYTARIFVRWTPYTHIQYIIHTHIQVLSRTCDTRTKNRTLHSRTHSARAKTHAKNKFAYARAPGGARKTCANDICILLFVTCNNVTNKHFTDTEWTHTHTHTYTHLHTHA